ncbi:MAG: hypothetical protein FJZ09_01725 [Candidatus Omnitrophica bacterium]|nr:hypothetical protein [Candidatus Omnitrophota bacterium]
MRVRVLRSFFAILLFAVPALAQVDADFEDKVQNLEWVAYSPTNYDPQAGEYPGEGSIRFDLETLIQHGFTGLVTYGASGPLAKIPEIARSTGFQGVIMGIWDISDNTEVQNAVIAAEYVDGYCMGNEGLNVRYDLKELNEAILGLRGTTAKPVTTSEQIFDYTNAEVLNLGDWVFPNIHPFLSEVKIPEKAVRWIESYYMRLKKNVEQDRIIFFKEVGFPTAGAVEATDKNQTRFFLEMEQTVVPFTYFEAFDQPWKRHLPVESHWGLFDSRRQPKRFMKAYGIKK